MRNVALCYSFTNNIPTAARKKNSAAAAKTNLYPTAVCPAPAALLIIALPSSGAISVGNVVDAFHTPMSFPAFASDGNTSIDKAQLTLV